MKGARRPGGFTLMEVLATIVLIGIVLPVAMQGISLAASLAETARHKAEAAVLVRSKFNELLATSEWQNGNLGGDFSPDHPEHSWSAELSAWQTTALQQLDIHVSWNSCGRQQSVTVSTLVDPEAAN
jgi:prepilin-type N-terminal cleavage/methylation domain-containing protein